MRAGAFTLTEMLVVVTIFGLVAGLAASGAPSMFERAELRQAHTRLLADLDAGAAYARRNGDFGALEIGNHEYRVRVGELTVAQRAMSQNVRISADPALVHLDPAGRYAAARVVLESPRHDIAILIDPLTGRPTRASDGADGSAGGRRHPRARRNRFPQPIARRWRRRRSRAPPSANGSACLIPPGGRQDAMAHRPACRSTCRAGLDARVRAVFGPSRTAHGVGRLRGDNFSPRGPALSAAERVRHRRGGLAPAMTLMELLVALTVFGLVAATALSPMGAWMAQGRARIDEARFWRAAAPAQLLLSELATGAIDGLREVTPERVRLRVFVPRLSPTPIEVELRIQSEDGKVRLVLNAPDVSPAPSVILDDSPPLRFTGGPKRLDLEALHRQGWTPIAVASLPADAPFVCSFDAIARQCR